MGHTYSQIYLHIVFSVKCRRRMMPIAMQKQMHSYVWRTLEGLGHKPIAVGGIEDHIHILIAYNLNVPIAETVKKVKSHSSKALNEREPAPIPFHWQSGYGCFSVSPAHCDAVAHYIKHQYEHHHDGISYEDELIHLLQKYHITYIPEYLPLPDDALPPRQG